MATGCYIRCLTCERDGEVSWCSYSRHKGKGRQSQFNSLGSSEIRRCLGGRTNDLGKQKKREKLSKEVKKTATYRSPPLTRTCIPILQIKHEREEIPGYLKGYPVGLAGCSSREVCKGQSLVIGGHIKLWRSRIALVCRRCPW